MSLTETLFGRRLASWEADHTRIGVLRGVPVLGLDALASAAYGPEAALTILIPLGAAGLRYMPGITIVILALLAILYLSYRQTIAAYPNGGGSYIVAKENLGTRAGLVAAASLLLDYVLNVAVGISAGVGALVSAIPALHGHIVTCCLAILALITLMNVRGLREAGLAFGIPTYLFVASMSFVIVAGVVKAIASGGHPFPVVAPPKVAAMTMTAGVWLLLRSFASGCTAMTGVEAVSNGVPVFVKPPVQHAQRTLTTIVAILGFFLAGIAYLVRAYGIVALPQESAGYQSVLSSLTSAVVGRGSFYYFTIAMMLAVLALSANTSFADFPRLCRLIAEDDFLPHSFANVGRRLVYSIGIGVLATLAAVLLIIFGGITDRLIPLFAVGAFGAFTLSQAGMVVHWTRAGARQHWHSLLLNAVGAATTAAALIVIIVAKFTEGAWITLLIIPLTLAVFGAVRRHYRFVERQLEAAGEIDVPVSVDAPVVVIPVKTWDKLTEKAVRFGMSISREVVALHIYSEREEADRVTKAWAENVEEPLRRAGLEPPQFVCVSSPYRRLFAPILNYVDELRQRRPGMVAVILPDMVEGRWWEYLLHTQRANVLRSLLLLKGNQRVVVISVPWYLERRTRARRALQTAAMAPLTSAAREAGRRAAAQEVVDNR